MVFCTHWQLACCPAAATFLHVPGWALDVVQAVPPPQTVPPILLTQGEFAAATSPTLCNRPGKPVSFEQVPAYVTAVDTVAIATQATITRSDEYNARISLFLDIRFKFGILQRSIRLPETSVKGFSSTFAYFDRDPRMTNRIRLMRLGVESVQYG